MTHASYLRPFALATVLASASPAAGGTIEVVVRTRDGAPVAGQDISLTPLSAYRWASRTGAIVSPATDIETTGDDGRLTFEDVDPGTYSVFVFGHLKDPTLVKAEANPLAPAPVVTLDDPGDRRRIELELWHGVPIRLEVTGLEGMPLDGFTAVFLHAETDVEVKRVSFRRPSFEQLLVPTVWDVSVDSRRGFELTGVELDGVELPAGSVRLDLAEKPWPQRLRFNFATTDWQPEGVVTVGDLHSYDAPLTVKARVPRARHGISEVEIYPLDDPSEPVRRAAAGGMRGAAIDGLPPGDYLIVVGGRHTLEGRAELRGFDPETEPREVDVELSWGAAIQIQALDLRDRPIADLEVEIERLGDDPEVLLREEDFRRAKRGRAGSTGSSGWYEARGFYPGRYLLRTRLRRASAADFRILLGVYGGDLVPGPELEVELGDGPVDVEVRVAPVGVE